MTRRCLCGNETEPLIHPVLGCRSMLVDSKVFGVYLIFFPLLLGMVDKNVLKTDASFHCCQEMLPVSEAQVPTSRVSSLKLDPVWMFLVPCGRNFGPCNHSFKYMYTFCKISSIKNICYFKYLKHLRKFRVSFNFRARKQAYAT